MSAWFFLKNGGKDGPVRKARARENMSSEKTEGVLLL